jgi:hypothetical protein
VPALLAEEDLRRVGVLIGVADVSARAVVDAIAPSKAGFPLQAVAELLAELSFQTVIVGAVVKEGRPELANIAVEY